VSACFDTNNVYFTKEEQAAALCTGNEADVVVGSFYNDVWSYDLNCDRYFDGPCEGTGWTIMHPGSLEGGCNIQLGIEVYVCMCVRRYFTALILLPPSLSILIYLLFLPIL
jgi:hypothetical protein